MTTDQTIDAVLVSSSDLKEIYDHMVGVWQMVNKDHGECGVTLEHLMDRGGHPVIAKVRALLAKSRTTYVIGTSHKCDKRVPYGRGVTIPCGTSVDGVVRYHGSCRVTSDPSKGLPPNGTKLYAQQPSPVSVVMRCSFCDVVNEHGSPWSGHSESVDGNLVYRVMGCKDHTHLVDACLDTFTRLNKKQD